MCILILDAGDACLVHQDCVGEGADAKQCSTNLVCQLRSVGVQTSLNGDQKATAAPTAKAVAPPLVEHRNAATSYDLVASPAKQAATLSTAEATATKDDVGPTVRSKFNSIMQMKHVI